MAQDTQLRELHQKVLRKRTLIRELSALHFKQQELDSKVKDLEKRKQAEQKDVDRLEKGGITSFFYSVIGKKEERLEKERAEAVDAMRQYEDAFLELEGVNRSIELKETELATLDGYEEKFDKMLQGKRRLLDNSASEAEREILKVEKELAFAREQGALLEEAVKLGERILDYVKQIQETLGEAEKVAIAQSASGMSTGIRKSELLSQAQKQVAMLQPLLKEFGQKVERALNGTHIQDNLNVVYEFGNGIYTSYVVGSTMGVVDIERIRTAKGNVMLLKERIQDVLPLLAVEKESSTGKIVFLEEQLEKLIIEA